MNNGLFKLGWNDLGKGIITAVISAIIVTVAGVVLATGFDVFKTDWISVGHSAVNTGVITLFAYLLKNLLTDSNGTVAGVVNLG